MPFTNLNDFLIWIAQPLHAIDAASMVLGFLYLYLEYRASIWLWVVSIIMPAVRSYIYFESGIYADFGMQFFYIAVAVYGFASWRWGHRPIGHDTVPIRHFPMRLLAPTIVGFAVLWGAIYFALHQFTDSTVPVLDAFTTAVSIVAYWALSRKWAEQWLLWFVVDVVSTCLYVYKEIPFTAALYGFYTVMAIVGYRKWLRMMQSTAVD